MPPRGQGQRQPPLGARIDRTHPLARGLVGAWLLNEVGGLTAFNALDLRGAVLSGTTRPKWVAAPWGSAVNFVNAQAHKITTSVPMPFGPFTLACRLRTPGGFDMVAIGQTTTRGPSLYIAGNGLHLVHEGVNDIGGGWKALTPNHWHHCVLTYDGTVRGYLDGHKDGERNEGTVFADPGSIMIGGYSSGSQAFQGDIDHVMVWNRRLSDREVAALYAEPYVMFDAPAPMRPLYDGHDTFMPYIPIPTTTYASSTTTDQGFTGGASIVIAKPSGTVAGSVLLAAIHFSATATITAPAGWFLIRNAGSSGSVGLACFWRPCDGSETATFTFTSSGPDIWLGAIVRYSGHAGYRPYFNHAFQNNTNTTLIAPALSGTAAPPYANMTVTCVYASWADETITLTPGQGQTERVNFGSNGDGLLISDFLQAVAGSTTDRNATQNVSNFYVGMQIAWRSAADPPYYFNVSTAQFTATNNASITPGLPGGWEQGDVGVLLYAKGNNDDLATPSGWTEVLAANQNNTTFIRAEVFVRRLQTGDTAPTLPGIGTVVRGALMVGVRGVPTTDLVTDWIVASSRSNNAASATITYATVTPPSDLNTFLLGLMAYEDDPTTQSAITGWTLGTVYPSALGNDMTLAFLYRAWASGQGATGALTNTISGGTFTNSVNVGILLNFSPGIPPTTDVEVDNPQIIVGTVVSQSLLYAPVFTPSAVTVVTSTSITATVGVSPSAISVGTATSVSLALRVTPLLATAAVSTSQSLLFSPVITPSGVSVIATTSVSVRLTITPALLTTGTATSQSLALRVTPTGATTAASTSQSLVVSARTEVVASTSITAFVGASTNTNVTGVAVTSSILSVGLALRVTPLLATVVASTSQSLGLRVTPGGIITAASTSLGLALRVGPAAVMSAASTALSLGLSPLLTSAALALDPTVAVTRAPVTDIVTTVASTSTSLRLTIAGTVVVVGSSTDALVGLIIVPGAISVAAGVVEPRVGYVIPSALVEVAVGVIDPSLVWRGRYRLAGTIRLVRPVTGTLSARPRV